MTHPALGNFLSGMIVSVIVILGLRRTANGAFILVLLQNTSANDAFNQYNPLYIIVLE
jgi:hypothetical protein